MSTYNSSFTATCPLCGAIEVIDFNYEDYVAWQAGTLVQDAFPYLTADKREQLMSGICTPCWDRSFGED